SQDAAVTSTPGREPVSTQSPHAEGNMSSKLRADVLPRIPRRTAAGRVRRPSTPSIRPPDHGRQVPREKSLRGFDFKANPSIDPAVVHTLAKCEWVKKGQPLCLIGDSGTDKSHLLIALGT